MDRGAKARMFTVGFSLTFFLFSIFAVAVVLFTSPNRVSSGTQNVTGNNGAVYLPTREEELTVLLVGREAGTDTPGTYILAGFRPFDGKIPILVLPKETLLYSRGQSRTLEAIFEGGGATAARDAMMEHFGVEIHRYVVMDLSAFVTAAGMLGGIEYDVPFEVTIQEMGNVVTVYPGMQLLDGRRAADLITYRHYPDGELTRLAVAGELTAGTINQKLDIAITSTAEVIFRTVINLINTDITYADYAYRLQAAEFLCTLQVEPAVNIPVVGNFSEDGGRFALDDTTHVLVQQYFGGGAGTVN